MSTKLLSTILTNSWNVNRRKSVNYINVVKFSRTSVQSKSADEPVKIAIPEPESGKIQAALLKQFSEPLVIENIEPPRLQNQSEVKIFPNIISITIFDQIVKKKTIIFPGSY